MAKSVDFSVQIQLAFAVPSDAQRSRLNGDGQPDVLALVEAHMLGCFRALQVYAQLLNNNKLIVD